MRACTAGQHSYTSLPRFLLMDVMGGSQYISGSQCVLLYDQHTCYTSDLSMSPMKPATVLKAKKVKPFWHIVVADRLNPMIKHCTGLIHFPNNDN